MVGLVVGDITKVVEVVVVEDITDVVALVV
jgi:hypothetical protein